MEKAVLGIHLAKEKKTESCACLTGTAVLLHFFSVGMRKEYIFIAIFKVSALTERLT